MFCFFSTVRATLFSCCCCCCFTIVQPQFQSSTGCCSGWPDWCCSWETRTRAKEENNQTKITTPRTSVCSLNQFFFSSFRPCPCVCDTHTQRTLAHTDTQHGGGREQKKSTTAHTHTLAKFGSCEIVSRMPRRNNFFYFLKGEN